MPIYTLITGVNGVGKSSLTGILKSIYINLGYIINVDKMTLENKGDAVAAGKKAVETIDDLISKRISFTQETTLSGHFIKKTILAARSCVYSVRMFYVGLNTCEECKQRIKNRVEKGGHPIDEADIERRFNKRFIDLLAILPYCNEARFFDNENGFIEVGEYKNGEIIAKNDYRPMWFDKLIMQGRDHNNKIGDTA